MPDVTALIARYNIKTTGNYRVTAVATDTMHGFIADKGGENHCVVLPSLAVPCLERHLLSVKAAVKKEVSVIFDNLHSRLEARSVVLRFVNGTAPSNSSLSPFLWMSMLVTCRACPLLLASWMRIFGAGGLSTCATRAWRC